MRHPASQVVNKINTALQDPRTKKRWQSSLGITIFTLFVLSSVVVNESVQALNQAAGNYGYYGGTYGYGGSTNSSRATSDQPPSTPGSQATSVGDGQVVVSWAEVTTTRTLGTSYNNHSTYRVVYNTTDNVRTAYSSNNADAALPSGASVWTNSNDSLLATRATIRTTITGLTNGTAYYFAAYACDTNTNCSNAPSASATGTPAAGGGGSGGGGGGSGAAAAGGGGAAAPTTATFPTAVPTTAAPTPAAPAPATVVTNVQNSASEFGVTMSSAQVDVAASFVSNGTTTATVKLGSGERLALVRDQLETLGRVDVSALEQLAAGQKPTARSLEKERGQLPKVLQAFVRLVGHRPNFRDAKEDLAWNTMMYRVRFSRDLNKERVGIAKFRAVYRRLPTAPLDWATVRAWAYALK